MKDHFIFLGADRDLANALMGQYDFNLVLLSILMSVLSAYTAFLISERIRAATKKLHTTIWIVLGALTMGGGVWAMHFIGMIAYKLPIDIQYDVLTTVISVVPSALASLTIVLSSGFQTITIRKTLGLSVAMGGGIGLMHYIGMAAMRMDATMLYDPSIFALSILVAVILAGVALRLKWWADKKVGANVVFSRHLLVASIVMGSAIAGMHYTGMAAMYVFPDTTSHIQDVALSTDKLTQMIAIVVILTLIALVIAIEVSRQIEIYRRMRDSETRQSTILKTLSDGVMIIDRKGIVNSVNPAVEKIFGYDAHEIVGKNVKMLMAGNHKSKHDGYLENYTSDGDIGIIGIGRDIKGMRKDGMPFPMEILVNEMTLHGEMYFVGTIRDISKRKRAEADIYKYSHDLEAMVEERTADMKLAVEEAERANMAKSEFLSRMSHELRTPMNAILGFAQLLEMDQEDFNETQCDNIDEILGAGRHLLNLINEVLDLAKIDSGKMEMSMEEVQLDDALKQSLTLIAPLADERGLTIQETLSGNDYSINADYTRMKQVLVNLLSNAVKYNRDNGKITIDGELVGDDRLRINVRDTGNGLTEKEISKLFTSFDRLDNSNSVEGTGIGLVITKHLIELMDGTIGVESTVGEGSNFWIEICLFKAT